jgi:dTDP-4-amino-4,6-dideoxygalactose transaminase
MRTVACRLCRRTGGAPDALLHCGARIGGHPLKLGVSIANAVALWGGVPVFVDIRPDTLNFDEELVEQAITPRTKAILPIHYAGVPAEMDQLNEIATRNSLFVVKDAAQAIGSKYEGRQAGSLGHLAAFSFQETKNIISGEGGALAINDPALIARTEIMREKGTDRKNFIRGQVDKYTRVDLGSSFLRGEPVAAFLFGKLEQFAAIQSDRGRTGKPMTRHCSRSIIAVCGHPSSHPIATPISHIYYIILPDPDCRQDLRMKTEGHPARRSIMFPCTMLPRACVWHARRAGLPQTQDLSARLVWLPPLPAWKTHCATWWKTSDASR